MSENLKTGLLVFIAALLVVNTVILVTDDGPSYADPSTDRASFERTAASNSVKNNKVALDQANIIDPLKTTASKAAPSGPITTLEFAEVAHDFGTITQDSENTKMFTFTNTGTEPLIIENAKGSCGCTVPEYPKEPIAPGEQGEIKVVYKPGKQKNAQSKNITITANTLPEKSVLTIKANVLEGSI